MDPLSILALVTSTLKTVFSISRTIYTFIDSAKKINKVLENLDREIKGLAPVLQEIETLLSELLACEARQIPSSPHVSLTLIQYSIDETQRTLQSLEVIFDCLRPPKKLDNGTKKALKQIELNFKEDEINDVRSRIQWHVANLQLALQTANL